VTRDRQRDRVRAASTSYCPHRFRRADCLGNVSIGRRRPQRNAAERFPHATLERGPADVQGKVEIAARILDEADHFGSELFEGGIVAHEPRSRELPLEVARKAVRIVAEQDGAHALVARGDQH